MNTTNDEKNPVNHEESFAYRKGIGDPDPEWQKSKLKKIKQLSIFISTI